jgi:DNA-binding MarR family transcriptional regulator
MSEPEYAAPTPGFLVWRLSTKWRTAVDRAVGPLGLTHAQYSLISSLLAMHERGLKPSQRELADQTGLEPLYVSKLARALEADDLIRRVADPDDSRAVRLSLTTEGHAVTVQASIIVGRLIDQLLAPIGGAAGDRAAGLARDLSALLYAPLGPTSWLVDAELVVPERHQLAIHRLCRRSELALAATSLCFCINRLRNGVSKNPILLSGDLAPVVCSNDIVDRPGDVRAGVQLSRRSHVGVVTRDRTMTLAPGSMPEDVCNLIETHLSGAQGRNELSDVI